jgi:hypothetical protein
MIVYTNAKVGIAGLLKTPLIFGSKGFFRFNSSCFRLRSVELSDEFYWVGSQKSEDCPF